jgi:hypothetical protein
MIVINIRKQTNTTENINKVKQNGPRNDDEFINGWISYLIDAI